MDPLSITASIIAVLQATNAVVSVCYDYSCAMQSSSWELPRVIEEVKDLRNVLETLEQLAKKAENADPAAEGRLPTLKLLCNPKGLLAMCLGELQALREKLDPPDWSGQVGSKRRAFVQALSWPLKESDTKKTLEKIGRLKATLNLALTVDQAKLMLAIQDMTGAAHTAILDAQADITQLHQSFTSIMIDDRRERLHRWLSAPDPSLNHNAACKKRQAKTGTWLVGGKQFAVWKTTPDLFFWLYGIPGCGKTILSSTIIEDVLHHCHLNSSRAAVYFYFDFNDDQKQSYEKMIRSLITHLSIRSASAPQALESLYSSKMNGSQQPTTNELLTTLRQIIQGFEETFVILDALDECKDRQELLAGIEEMVRWKTGKLHMLVTSRKENDIEEWLKPLSNEQGKICIQSALVNDDIRTYVHERIHTDRGLKRWQKKPEVQQEIETTLMNKADGMFRWAVCQLDTLGSCLNLPMLRKALASLPKTLDDTYARILYNIDDENSENALKILQWLAYSARPLQIKEVAEVITVNVEHSPRFDSERRFPEPRDILTICSSLVTTTTGDSYGEIEDPDGEVTGEQVRLAHFSVKEYLVSERIQAGSASRYSLRKIHANVSIAETCLAYLLQFDHPNSLILQTFEEFPLARYAAKYWTQHAQYAGADMNAIHLLSMELFLQKKDAYLNWIRLFDPDRPWREPDISMGVENDWESVPSPLYYASLTGLVESARVLLEYGADVNAQGGSYGTALQAASAGGHDRVVQRLLENGADVNAQGGHYGTALQAASTGSHDRVVHRLLENGADVNAQGGHYGTALQAASAWGHDRVVQWLLENRADVNAQGGHYRTALQAASSGGHDRVVQRLLENGADVNAQGGHYGTALQAASFGGRDQVVQRLLENGADVNVQGGPYGTALQAASVEGYDWIVQRLLENGADVNSQGGHYGTALQVASYGGHDQVVQRLLENGADVNAQGGHYGTALQVASVRGHDQVVQRLLENGADVNVQGGYYGTALQAASSWGRDQVVHRLLESGADVNAQGGYYGTALEAASAEGHDQIVQRLKSALRSQ